MSSKIYFCCEKPKPKKGIKHFSISNIDRFEKKSLGAFPSNPIRFPCNIQQD